jgi:hypothetical protein
MGLILIIKIFFLSDATYMMAFSNLRIDQVISGYDWSVRISSVEQGRGCCASIIAAPSTFQDQVGNDILFVTNDRTGYTAEIADGAKLFIYGYKSNPLLSWMSREELS